MIYLLQGSVKSFQKRDSKVIVNVKVVVNASVVVAIVKIAVNVNAMNDRNKYQDQAVKAWLDNKKVGTIKAATGFGKMFVFFKALYAALEKNLLNVGDTIFFFAETKQREDDLNREARKFESLFGKNPMRDFNIQFYCYQAMPEGDRIMDCYDEIDFALTEIYGKTLRKSPAKLKLGLTATLNENDNVFKSKIPEDKIGRIKASEDSVRRGIITTHITKGQLLSIICPIVWELKIKEAIDNTFINDFQIIQIPHKLDNVFNNIKIFKNQKVPFTEAKAYEILENGKMDITKTPYLRRWYGHKQSHLLWNLESKIPKAKKLIRELEAKGEKTIVFAPHLAYLSKITPNVATGKASQDIVDAFNNNKILTIASSKKLERGITLKGVQNLILVSYYSTLTSFIQKLGRVLRKDKDNKSKVYIFVTSGTLEEKWFHKLVEDTKGEIEYDIQ